MSRAGYEEKPSLAYTVSMGVYVLEPGVRASFPPTGRSTSPISSRRCWQPASGRDFPYDGYWLDIGRQSDYEQALAEFDRLRPQLLPGTSAGDGPTGTA